jgi:hypothetical protein
MKLAVVGALCLALVGCGSTATSASAPGSPTSCAAKMRLANPSLTQAQVVFLCSSQGSAQPPPPSPSAFSPVSAPAPATITSLCSVGREVIGTDDLYPLGSPTPSAGYYAGIAVQVQMSLPASAVQSQFVGDITVIFYSTVTRDPSSEVGSGIAVMGQVLEPGATLFTTVLEADTNVPASTVACNAPSFSSN